MCSQNRKNRTSLLVMSATKIDVQFSDDDIKRELETDKIEK